MDTLTSPSTYVPYEPPTAGENRLTLSELRHRLKDFLNHDALTEIPFSGDSVWKGKFNVPKRYLRLDTYTKNNALMQAYQRFKVGGADVKFTDVQLAWHLLWLELETGYVLELGQLFRYTSWKQHSPHVIVGVWGQSPVGSQHDTLDTGIWWVWGRRQTKNGWDTPKRWAIEGLDPASVQTIKFELLPLPPLAWEMLDEPLNVPAEVFPEQLTLF